MADGDVLQVIAGHQALAPLVVVSDVQVAVHTLTLDEIVDFLFQEGVAVVPGVPDKLLWPISASIVSHPVGNGLATTQPQRLWLNLGPSPFLEIVDATAYFASTTLFGVFVPPVLAPSAGLSEVGSPVMAALEIEAPTGDEIDGGTVDIIVVYREVEFS